MEMRGVNPNSLATELEKLNMPVHQPTIFRILSGESQDPRTNTIKPLADYFGVTVSQLRDHDFVTQGFPSNDKNTIHSVVSIDQTEEATGAIVYWTVKGSCGGGKENFEEMAKGQLIKEASFFKKYGVAPEDALAVYADGNSMADFIVDGDIAIFNRKKTTPKTGKIFLIEHPDGLKIKQLRRNIDGSWVLESRNPDKRQYPDEVLPESQAELLKILGEFFYRQGG